MLLDACPWEVDSRVCLDVGFHYTLYEARLFLSSSLLVALGAWWWPLSAPDTSSISIVFAHRTCMFRPPHTTLIPPFRSTFPSFPTSLLSAIPQPSAA